MSKAETKASAPRSDKAVAPSPDAPDLVSTAVPALFDPNTSPSHLLHRAQQVAADLHVDSFGASGLTQRQVAVLAVLSAKGGVSQSDLVTKTGIDRSTLAEMVARMEAKGLMMREKSPTDSRAKSVSLTVAGQDAISDAIPKLIAIDAAVLSLLSAGRRQTLVELLTAISLPKGAKKVKKAGKETLKSSKKIKKNKDRKKKKA